MSFDRKPFILVVDDDENLQKLIVTLLNRAGMDAVTAGTVSQAVQVLRQPPMPDLMLLDLMLPDVNGIEFLRRIREKPAFDVLPVVILSALADPDQIREGLNTGADRYLTKPYLSNNLVKTVQEVLRTGRRK